VRTNRFLASLAVADAARLEPLLRRRALERDDPIAAEGAPVVHVVLPIDSIVSVTAVMRDGRQVETRTIGYESGFGLLHALGSPVSFERVQTQVPGEAVLLPLEVLRRAAAESPALTDRIVRFAQASLVQSAQSTACNALHTAEQRLCRWLCMTQDRTGKDVLPLTQEHLSIMVGVQRTTVTAIAAQLQEEGLIAYSRGKVRLRDPDAVHQRACECRDVINRAVDDIVGPAAGR
jgi:CRP-like cAMP-binding protein